MKSKSLLIGSLIALGCILSTAMIHANRIAAVLPGYCYKCGKPGVLPTQEVHKLLPANRWHECWFCGERFHQNEVLQVAGNDIPWQALAMEWVGLTDSGPITASQTLPDTGSVASFGPGMQPVP